MQLLNTLQGRKSKAELINFQILPHEHLFQNLSKRHEVGHNLQVNLQNINHLRKYPYRSLDNLKLNDLNEIAHELSMIKEPLVIIESTNLQYGMDVQKLCQLTQMLPQVIILFGYSIPEVPRDSQTLIIYSKENVHKKIELEIQYGTEGNKPSFFGELLLKSFDTTDWLNMNFLESFFYYSHHLGIPIILNLEYDQSSLQIMEQIIQQFCTTFPNAKLMICNPPIKVEQTIKDNDSLLSHETQISNIQDLINIGRLAGVVIFDILQFEHQDLLLHLVKVLNNILKDKFLISSGVNFKVDLTKYGGSGYEEALKYQKTSNETILDMFNWVVEKIIVVEIKMWQCPICQQEFDDSLEKIKKFDTEYCSTKCLRLGLRK